LHLSLPVVSDSDDRPDLLAFDRALWYAEDEGTLNTAALLASNHRLFVQMIPCREELLRHLS